LADLLIAATAAANGLPCKAASAEYRALLWQKKHFATAASPSERVTCDDECFRHAFPRSRALLDVPEINGRSVN
jgi:hypothetical protein